jgi:hypothetical protein
MNALMKQDDGFNFNPDGRLIRGDIPKFRDGRWTHEGEFLVVGKKGCLQKWVKNKPVETITEQPLPNVDDLNAAVNVSEWEDGINGPRPPWQYQILVYLLSPKTGAVYTYASGTIGARIAVDRLTERIATMRMLRGDNVVPLVTLDNAPFKTKYGERLRPEFKIIGWRALGGGPTEPKAIAGITPVDSPTTAEELNDEIGF